MTAAGGDSYGVNLVGTTGTFTANGGSLNTMNLAAFRVSGGASTVTYTGTITDDLGVLVEVNGTTGGTKTFSGAISDGNDGDGSGITLVNNTGATIAFSGGLTLATGANPAFAATGGGTVTVTGTNTIVTTTGTALNVANTTIGASGLTFQSISANGAPNGIVLNSTGSTAGLTVTGTGTAGTGGTIQNTTSDGVRLTSVGAATSFSFMNLTNIASGATIVAGAGCRFDDVTAACESAFSLDGATNVTIDDVVIDLGDAGMEGISGFNVNGLTVTDSQILNVGDADNESAVLLQSLSGTVLFEDLLIDDPTEYGMRINQVAGNANITLRRVTIQNNINTFGESAFQIFVFAGTTNLLIDDSDFLNTDAGIHGNTQNSATLNMTVQNSVFNENRSLPHGINFTTGDASTGRLLATGNTITGCAVLANCSLGIDLDASTSSTLDATIMNNTITNTGIGGGIEFLVNENASGRATISNNTITLPGVDRIGMNFQARSVTVTGTGRLDLNLTGNTISGVDSTIFGFSGMNFQSGASGVLVHNNTVCANITGNTVNGNTGNGSLAYTFRQRVSTIFQMQGVSPSPANGAQVQTLVTANNPLGTLAGVSSVAGAGGTTIESYTAATCLTPTLPTLP
jgi:large repetitive protein